jgi:serine phosphatase RsbU (regulator of sigma subunit)
MAILGVCSKWLGVFRDWQYEDTVACLESGDRVFLFTDGITEATRSDGEEFGEAGILEAVLAGAHLSPSDLKAHLLAQVNRFCSSQLHDDATLLLIAAEEARVALDASSDEKRDREVAAPHITS